MITLFSEIHSKIEKYTFVYMHNLRRYTCTSIINAHLSSSTCYHKVIMSWTTLLKVNRTDVVSGCYLNIEYPKNWLSFYHCRCMCHLWPLQVRRWPCSQALTRYEVALRTRASCWRWHALANLLVQGVGMKIVVEF